MPINLEFNPNKPVTHSELKKILEDFKQSLFQDLRASRKEQKEANKFKNPEEKPARKEMREKFREEKKARGTNLVLERKPKTEEEYNNITVNVNGEEVDVSNSSKFLLDMIIPKVE